MLKLSARSIKSGFKCYASRDVQAVDFSAAKIVVLIVVIPPTNGEAADSAVRFRIPASKYAQELYMGKKEESKEPK